MKQNDNSKNEIPDKEYLDIASSGSDANELEVPLSELVAEYPGTDKEQDQHGQ